MNIKACVLPPALLLAGVVSMASAESLATQCGAVLRSTVKTTTDPFIFNAELPHVTVPNGVFTVNVPTGAERCITLTFSASARCPNACFISVLDTNGFLEPFASNRFAQGESFRAQSFKFVKRVGEGNHAIKLQINTGNEIENAQIGPYTVRLDVSE
jgi:hypothetical protein